MVSTFNDILCGQYQAALHTLKRCVDQCPEELWQQPVVNNPFSQSVFHCLFFTDLYLCPNIKKQPLQKFHQEHADVFAGYEQLEIDQATVGTYEKNFINKYLDHCLGRVQKIVPDDEIEDMYVTFAGFPWLSHLLISEVHLYNIRHIQHHAAQMVAFLRKEAGIEIGWVKSGSE